MNISVCRHGVCDGHISILDQAANIGLLLDCCNTTLESTALEAALPMQLEERKQGLCFWLIDPPPPLNLSRLVTTPSRTIRNAVEERCMKRTKYLKRVATLIAVALICLALLSTPVSLAAVSRVADVSTTVC